MEAEILSEHEYQRRREAATEEETIDKLAWLMDRAVNVGGIQIGLDPIIGLIPGFGDVVGGLVSATILIHAHRAGIPRATMMRMVANVGIDSALGSIPVVGDVFDIAWKANSRNLALYRSAVRGERRKGKDTVFLALLLFALMVLVAIPVLIVILAVKAIGS